MMTHAYRHLCVPEQPNILPVVGGFGLVLWIVDLDVFAVAVLILLAMSVGSDG